MSPLLRDAPSISSQPKFSCTWSIAMRSHIERTKTTISLRTVGFRLTGDGPPMYLVVYKYFLVLLNWLDCNKKYLVVYNLEPCIAQPPRVAVGKSCDKMIANVPIYGIPLSRKTLWIKAEGTGNVWFKMRVMPLWRRESLNQHRAEMGKKPPNLESMYLLNKPVSFWHRDFSSSILKKNLAGRCWF